MTRKSFIQAVWKDSLLRQRLTKSMRNNKAYSHHKASSGCTNSTGWRGSPRTDHCPWPECKPACRLHMLNDVARTRMSYTPHTPATRHKVWRGTFPCLSTRGHDGCTVCSGLCPRSRHFSRTLDSTDSLDAQQELVLARRDRHFSQR